MRNPGHDFRLFVLVLASALTSFIAAQEARPRNSGAADWWSLKPVVRPALPDLSLSDRAWCRNALDYFVLEKLRAKGLRPAAEADKRTLIRRLYFDLIGLPPAPEEIEAFVRDSSKESYEQLVERLLASPQYGERWGRHWLDVVHYGDTHGYDKDKPRPNAWPYRDYVVRVFNSDKPYARFVQEQIAGDVLFPGTVDGIEALGFIAAGPWDFIGHAEVAESKIDGKIARHLDRDDMVTNTMMTFMSLTVQCAQCHNHKFDPIPQEDYYRLQAVFAALDRADKKYYRDPQSAKQAERLQSRLEELKRRRRSIEDQMARQAGPRLAELDAMIAAAKLAPETVRKHVEYGYHSAIEQTADTVKWVQIDLGESAKIDRVVVIGCHDEFNNIGAGFGFPRRFRIELSDDPKFARGVAAIVDRSRDDVPNPGVEPLTFRAKSAGRFVRITATKLAPRQNDYIFALAEVQVFDSAGTNIAAGKTITSLDSIEAAPRWRITNLVDGHYPVTAKQNQPSLVELQAERRKLLAGRVEAETRAALEETVAAIDAADRELRQLPAPALVYAGTVHAGSGAFVGTGANGGRPRPVHLLPRGDVKKPGPEVAPGALTCVAGLPSKFALPAGHAEGERRAALARWLTDARNPLLWRSIVNRVWRYHFGRGIVETPNDFGRMGQLPTHPELLDWLASEFRDRGGSIKQLHRLIVTSNTYRQSSTLPDGNDQPQSIDADNSLYWRMNRRRLEAEAVRDSVLAVSGKLDRRMGGPAFQDFVIEKPEHSPHYQYHLHDPEDRRTHRRSVYRFLVRSQQQPFMTTLDCADPSMQVDRRNETISSLQALALLNNDFMLAMSRYFAARVQAAAPDTLTAAVCAFRLALGREPTGDEQKRIVSYAQTHGLANTCRVILNLNEFMFVD